MSFILLHICISMNVLIFRFRILSWNIKADSSVFLLFLPKWHADISLCLGMYEVISNIFRCSKCSEETDKLKGIYAGQWIDPYIFQ